MARQNILEMRRLQIPIISSLVVKCENRGVKTPPNTYHNASHNLPHTHSRTARHKPRETLRVSVFFDHHELD